jgi:hypothetical protein
MGLREWTVRAEELHGETVGTYRHPGGEADDEPDVGDLINVGGSLWRVVHFMEHEDLSAANNVLVVVPPG